MKEELLLSLFTEDMIAYIENPMNSTMAKALILSLTRLQATIYMLVSTHKNQLYLYLTI